MSAPNSISGSGGSLAFTLGGVASVGTNGTSSVVDSNGNTYLGGLTFGALNGETPIGTQDVFLTKINSSRQVVWTKLIGVSSVATQGASVAMDSSGSIYISGGVRGSLHGETHNGGAGKIDNFLVKYDSSGARQWTRLQGVATKDMGTGFSSMSIDSSDTIYLSISSGGNLGGETLAGVYAGGATVQYDTSGTRNWVRLDSCASQPSSLGTSVADSSGNVYSMGFSFCPAINGETQITSPKDTRITKRDNAGTLLWTKRYGVSSGNGTMDIDANGNFFFVDKVTANTDGETLTGTADALVVMHDSSRVRQWTRLLGAASATTAAKNRA